MYADVPDVSLRIDISQYPRYNLEKAIRVATARIEQYCDRVFTRVPATSGYETRDFLGGGSTILTIDDLLEWESVTVDDVAATLTDLRQMPYGSTPTTWIEYKSGAAWTAGAEVAISGAWGYAETVPWDIWDACVALVVRAIERAKTAYQDASAIPELGQIVYAKALPADVRDVLNRYRRTAL
jgi:hypothetical protein